MVARGLGGMRVAVLGAAFAVSALAANAADPEGGAAHWGYDGAMGPGQWGRQFATCALGTAQSPVDIKPPFERATQALTPHYKSGPLRLIHNGHTVQVNVAPGSTLMVGGQAYALVQYHFHRPSEERIDGKPMAMVAHLVHQGASGQLVVVGVLMRESARASRALRQLWRHLPPRQGPEVAVAGVTINPVDLLPRSRGYYSYEGSLTTPPCTEGVKFFIMKTPIGIRRDMIERFPFKHNARPVQPLNGRTIAAS